MTDQTSHTLATCETCRAEFVTEYGDATRRACGTCVRAAAGFTSGRPARSEGAPCAVCGDPYCARVRAEGRPILCD